VEYWLHYFSNRRFPKNQEFYVVYTNMDHSIPFQPDSALDYWLINLKFIPTSIELGDATSGESFNDIRHAYVDIAKEGGAAFRQVPTIMPHFTEHSGHALHMAQTLLKPIKALPPCIQTTEGEESKLPKIMERYFQEIGLPRAKREQSNCLYDLKQKVLVYSPELKVGKGLL